MQEGSRNRYAPKDLPSVTYFFSQQVLPSEFSKTFPSSTNGSRHLELHYYVICFDNLGINFKVVFISL